MGLYSFLTGAWYYLRQSDHDDGPVPVSDPPTGSGNGIDEA